MSPDNPFELPEPVVEAAIVRLTDLPVVQHERVLGELLEQFPDHAAGLRALADTMRNAERALGGAFAQPGVSDSELPHFEGYQLLRKLGEGAFGIVYLCEQAKPIPRLVAIKLLRPGVGDRNTLLRFDAERQFLARLQHPAIAQIHAAGTLADGRPWFVMEHVDGVPLTKWCDRECMGVDDRLRLFARLCQGVQYAHEQGIVHRDLKPSNVLVRAVDGEARPKIIDFGIARALQVAPGCDTPRTEPGRIVGTPGYMSPEQAAGRLDEVDERSDVWSLGAILFELLTGSLPFAAGSTASETDVEPPSRRCLAWNERARTTAERRRTDPRRLASRVRGELDWIVGKALMRERASRYASVQELSTDVLRHLRGEPVHAGPPTWTYRLRKFARRRRTLIAVLATSLALVTGGSVLLAGYRARATTSDRAADAAVQALVVRANDPNLVSSPNGAAARRALAEDALAFYDRFLAERPTDPESLKWRALTVTTLAEVHWLSGNTAASDRLIREAVAGYEPLLANSPGDVQLLQAAGLAQTYLARSLLVSDVATASRHYAKAVDLLERAKSLRPASGSKVLVNALLHLAMSDRGRADKALVRAEELQRAACDAPGATTEDQTLLVQVLVESATQALRRDDAAVARDCLQRATGIADRHAIGFDARYRVAIGQSVLAGHDGSPADRLRAELAVVETARAWLAAEPLRFAAHAAHAVALLDVASLQQASGQPWLVTADAAVSATKVWVERFPASADAREGRALAVRRRTEGALVTGRRQDLEPLEPLVREACELLAPSAALSEPRRLQSAWVIQSYLGYVADALAVADGDKIWEQCAASIEQLFGAALPGEHAVTVIACGNRIVRRLLAVGSAAEAGTWLARMDAWYRTHQDKAPQLAIHSIETARLRVVAAVQAGDWPSARAIAEATRLVGHQWRAAAAAAESMSLVWIAARAAQDPLAAEVRDRAEALCEEALAALAPIVATAPDNPWVVEPWWRLRIRRAQAAADRGAAIEADALREAVTAYAAAEPVVHAFTWDAAVLAEARRLLEH